MKSSIAKPQFVLLFTTVMLISHTLAELPEHVEKRLIASRKRYHEARLAASANGDLESTWAGAIQLQPPDQPFDLIAAEWTVFDPVPPAGTLVPNALYDAAVWVGFDGADTAVCPDRVIQAGVSHWFLTDENGQFEQSGASAFVEWFPDEAIFTGNYVVNPNDQIAVTVQLGGPTAAIATFENPNNVDPPFQKTFSPTNAQYYACGSSAEWIIEAPSLPLLPNFGLLDVDSCVAYLGNVIWNLDGAALDNIIYNGVEVVQSTVVYPNEMSLLYASDP